mgnify:CR=1 FL=1
MQINLTPKEFRRLLDLVYIGNWILNSTGAISALRIMTRWRACCSPRLPRRVCPPWPSSIMARSSPRAFAEGGDHEAIMEYENNVFFDILAEDLARRDMDDAPIDESNYDELASRIDAYISEFEEHGTDNILVDIDIL